MAELSRRRLLGSALGASGLAAVSSLFPYHLGRAVARPAKRLRSLDEIEHVVILMQENRSFDHYFGTLHGVRGFDDPDAVTLPDGRSVFHQPDPANPEGYLLPFHLDTRTTSSQAIPSTSHAWTVQHAAVNGGKMDNWVPAHRKADGEKRGPYTMGYYERDDIPFHFALAEAFTLCDAYHCSVLGPTWPNRLYLWTGTIDPGGRHGGPVTSNDIPRPFRWTTYAERLTAAGVSWHVYQEEDDYGCNPLEFFQAFQDAGPGDPLYEHGLTITSGEGFADDARAGRLPTVSWIVPASPQCEHPDYLPAAGADFLARQLDAVAANPAVWDKTVFIINYDENDGLFDHVVPPMPPPGTPDEFARGAPIGAGIRVPCFVVSPWSQGGYVAGEPFDHTSVLRFLERVTGVREPNISDWRRRTFGDLTSALGLPAGRPFPRLPETRGPLWRAEHDVATLPPAAFPGEDQEPPHQEEGVAAARPPAASGEAGKLRGARPYGRSRLLDGSSGGTGAVFPRIQESVPKRAPAKGVHVYAAGIVSNTVSVVDATTHKLVAAVDAGINPYGIARTPDGRKLYITNSGAADVSVLDTAQGRIVSTVTVGLYPHGIAVSPDGAYAYVADTGPDGPGGSTSVSVIRTATDKVTATWHTGPGPRAVALAPDGRTLYVACADGLFVVDTGHGAVRTRHPGQARAGGLAVHPDGSRVYVANTWDDTLSVLDARGGGVRAALRVGRNPWQVVPAPDGGRVYVTSANDDTVTAVDADGRRVLGTVRVGHVPTGITVAGGTLWVATNASSTLDAVDAASLAVVARTPLGLATSPSGVAVV
ncbi:phospholipase C [Streptomyces caatingaensis]|uniref:phospholipase C n=1 Tax=Streptomyces caatingaensis TaxID=1678637 RepID=A0A0K9XBN4_9ACTN|nr:phospholipase C [Streptomyces caatingaensis]